MDSEGKIDAPPFYSPLKPFLVVVVVVAFVIVVCDVLLNGRGGYSRIRNKCPVFILAKVFPHGPALWRNVASTV